MIKYIVFVLILMLCFSVALPASATVCRNWDGQKICIVQIKRSAKNYWEYRAVISVDGIIIHEVYNCRERQKIQQDGTVLPFGRKDPGELICSFFQK